jgi:hypothetical protein
LNVWSIDVKIYGTAYIKAETAEEALKIAQALKGEAIQFSDRRQQVSEDIFVTGERYTKDLPPVSLSPVMELHGPDEGVVPNLSDELEDEDDDD